MVDLNQLIGDEQKGDLGQLTTTIAQFYRVSGSSTQHNGVVPDIVYPTAAESEDQGERALDNALPWDRIHAADFAARELRLGSIDELRQQHLHRVQNDPEFSYLMAEIEASREAQTQEIVSLLEQERREEIRTLEEASLVREKRLRRARELPARAENQAGDAVVEFNPDQVLLEEAAHILHDSISSGAGLPEKLQAADYER
jgi:carboxyl-terminal processing protease